MKHTWIGHSWTTPRPTIVPRVVLTQYSERPSWGLSGRNVHQLWILDYARTDCGLARVGSPRAPWLPRKARTANLYPPGTPYWEDTSGLRNPIREAYVIFAGGEAGGLRRLITPSCRFGRIVDPGGRLDAPFHDMALAGQTLGAAGFWRAQAALATIFDLLRSAAPQADGSFLLLPQGPPVAPAGLVEATRQYFQARLAEKVTLTAVARQLGMSSSTFSHRYVAETGQSPMAALTALRVELARNLLLRGLKMETIAQQTGFCDAFHFSKAFKRHCGQTPSEFRGSWQSGRRSSL